MITQYDETGNSMLTNTPVNKPAGVTTVQSLASQYRNALTERARRAKELRTPAGFGAPGYWWRGYTPYVAPGGVAAPVMTAGNGAGMPSTYSGVTGAEPTPTVDPTIDPTVDPTIDPTIDPNIAPIEEPVVETTPAAGKAGLYSMAAPAWAKEWDKENGGNLVIDKNPPRDWMKYWVARNNPFIQYALDIKPFGSEEKYFAVGEPDNEISNYGAIPLKDWINDWVWRNNTKINYALDIKPFGIEEKFYPVGEQNKIAKAKKNDLPRDWMKYWVERNNMLPRGSDKPPTPPPSPTLSGYNAGWANTGGGWNGGGGGGGSSYLPWWKWNLLNWRIE